MQENGNNKDNRKNNSYNKRSEYLKTRADQHTKKPKTRSDEPVETAADNILGYAIPLAIVAMALIVVIIVVLITKWSKGRDINASDIQLSEDYSTESLDWYAHFDPNENEDYVDDGVYNILIIGDDSIYDYNDETGIPALIANATGANVQVLALPEASIALSTSSYTPDNPKEAYSLIYQAAQVAGRNFSLYDVATPLITDSGSLYADYYTQLSTTDFDSIDVLIICMGMNDYLNARPIEVTTTTNDKSDYGNLWIALDMSVRFFISEYPNMQVIYSTPTYFMVPDAAGHMVGADTQSNGVSTFADYVTHMSNVCSTERVTFVDNLFGFGIDETNASAFLTEDLKYPNAETRQRIADHIVSFIYFVRNK